MPPDVIPPTESTATVARDCLLRIGAALLAGSAPVPDVEAQLARIGRRLGVPHLTAAATPTGVFVGTTLDRSVAFAPVGAMLRFEQMTRLQDVVDGLLARNLSASAALLELDEIEDMPRSRPAWLCDLAIAPIAVGICAIMQPTRLDLAAAAIGGLFVVGLVVLSRRSTLVRTLLPLLAAFGVALIVLTCAHWWDLEGTLRTMVATFAVLLPGSLIVTGMSEIAAGAAVAGTARLATGTVQLVLFSVGLFAAVAVTGQSFGSLTNVRADELGPLAPYLGIVLVGAGIVVNVAASRPAIPWIFGVLLLTFVVQSTVQGATGVALGALAGAIVAGLSSSVVRRLSGQPLSLVVFLPAFWLLVPGSLGLLSTAELAAGHDGLNAVTTSVAAIVSVVVGTLVGGAAGRALDRLLDPYEPTTP
jgi:uncharacterized membrane protein YjjP (DUF1212 family)